LTSSHAPGGPPKALRQTLTGLALLVVMGMSWSLSFVLSKVAREAGAGSFALLLWEGLGSGILLFIAGLAIGRRANLDRRHAGFHFINGMTGLTLPGAIVFTAAPHLPAGILTMVVALAPIMTYIYVLALKTEQFDWRRIFGLVLGFVGVGLIVLPNDSLPNPDMVGWALLGFLAAAIYAAQGVYLSMRTPIGLDALGVSCGMVFAGGIIAIPGAMAMGDLVVPTLDWPPLLTVQCAFAMMVINAEMMGLFVWLIRAWGPVFAAQVANVVTLSGLFWGWLIYDELPSTWVVGAVASIVLGVVLVSSPRRGADLAD
jgi:drug/metabolite transporter (DMT)-like permease